jgi:hypothetical protein
MFLDLERECLAYPCLTCFVGSDDEDARRSGAGGRGILQVRLKQITSNLEPKDTLKIAVTNINQTLFVYIYCIWLFGHSHLFCEGVLRVPGYRSRGPGEYNSGATWKNSSGFSLESQKYGSGDPLR